MKILNLYAGIGGNRKLWEGVEVTAVEIDRNICEVYRSFFPDDTVICADAHDYLINHFHEFDFIWSSPPCPTHSKQNMQLKGYGIYRFPDMGLYQEIIFLKHFFKGRWVVENVIPYYKPLIAPSVSIDRHHFWSNFAINDFINERMFNVSRAKKEELSAYHKIELPPSVKDKRKLLRNCVNPQIGAHIIKCAVMQTKQLELLQITEAK